MHNLSNLDGLAASSSQIEPLAHGRIAGQPESAAPWKGDAEAARLEALARYGILDTPPEQHFDDIVTIASQIFQTPVALVGLIASDRQWFKANVGFAGSETPISQSVCAHALQSPEPLVIPDLTVDPRTRDNALVTGAPHVRFYAGARLETADGVAIGALCVIDSKPRPAGLTLAERQVLQALARQVMAHIEQRRTLAAIVARVAEEVRDQSWTWQVSPALLGLYDADGTMRQTNLAWQTTLGWSKAEIEGMKFFDLVHPDDRAQTMTAWRDALAGVPLLDFENRCRASDGGYRWVSWFAVPRRGRLFCSGRDITKAAEQAIALDASRAERDRLWRLSTDLMLVANFEGGVIAVNPAWTATLGWEQGEVVGRPYLEFIHPDDAPSTTHEMARLADGAKTFNFENRYRCKDGSFRTLAWTAVPGEQEVYGIARDVTAERLAQKELAEAQEVVRHSQKMRAVGQLTGGLAHDFNNLMTGVLGNLALLKMRLAQGRIVDVERYASAAESTGTRAAALTNRLLAFSRREALDPRPTEVDQLVAGLTDLIDRTVGPEITVETRTPAVLWRTLVDPGLLENALLNLCINARDAMPGGGTLTIAMRNEWLDQRALHEGEDSSGAYVVVSVSDTGVGMAPDIVARAFEPFFTTKPAGVGTGLGLSMVYGFVQQSGGFARISSEVGQGTTVSLWLPRFWGAAENETPAATTAAAGLSGGQGKTVLIVDDEPSIRTLVSDVLGDLGHVPIEAAASDAGLKLLRAEGSIDLLITDIGLPGGMNGRQLAKIARSIRPELKVLFITGYAVGDIRRPGHLESGMSLLNKPFNFEALATQLNTLLGS